MRVYIQAYTLEMPYSGDVHLQLFLSIGHIAFGIIVQVLSVRSRCLNHQGFDLEFMVSRLSGFETIVVT